MRETIGRGEIEKLSHNELIELNLRLTQELHQTIAHENLYLDVASVPVSYTHLTLPTIYSV